jgi:integrase
MAKDDIAAVTVMSYRRVLNNIWRPQIGRQLFRRGRYSSLVKIADGKPWSKKTYNNAISILKRAFDFGYRDHPEHFNPARELRCVRIKKKDRPQFNEDR